MTACIIKLRSFFPFHAIALIIELDVLRKIARKHAGYKGIRKKWTLDGLYIMTLWKEEEGMNRFLNDSEFKEHMNKKWDVQKVKIVTQPSYNFIPWKEAIALIQRNGKSLGS